MYIVAMCVARRNKTFRYDFDIRKRLMNHWQIQLRKTLPMDTSDAMIYRILRYIMI